MKSLNNIKLNNKGIPIYIGKQWPCTCGCGGEYRVRKFTTREDVVIAELFSGDFSGGIAEVTINEIT